MTTVRRLLTLVLLNLGLTGGIAVFARGHQPAGYALNPVRGIGPVRIGEYKWRVERALGRRTHHCSSQCLRRYDNPRGDLAVNYVDGRVNEIGSTSPQITLHGLRLGLGPKRLHTILASWRYVSCQGYEYVRPGARASTSIAFGRHGSVDINVFSGAIGGCGAP